MHLCECTVCAAEHVAPEVQWSIITSTQEAAGVLRTVLRGGVDGVTTQTLLDRLAAAYADGQGNRDRAQLIAGMQCVAVLQENCDGASLLLLWHDLQNHATRTGCCFRERLNTAYSAMYHRRYASCRHSCMEQLETILALPTCGADVPPEEQVAEVVCCIAATLYGLPPPIMVGRWRPEEPNMWRTIEVVSLQEEVMRLQQRWGPGWCRLQQALHDVPLLLELLQSRRGLDAILADNAHTVNRMSILCTVGCSC